MASSNNTATITISPANGTLSSLEDTSLTSEQTGNVEVASTSRRYSLPTPGLPSSEEYSLWIAILEAQNLTDKNVSHPEGHPPHRGTNDPLCYVSSSTKKFKTKHKVNTLNPKWNESFIFERVNINDVITLIVRDKVTVGKGHCFGVFQLTLKDFPTKVEERVLVLEAPPNQIQEEAKLIVKLMKQRWIPGETKLSEPPFDNAISDSTLTTEHSAPSNVCEPSLSTENGSTGLLDPNKIKTKQTKSDQRKKKKNESFVKLFNLDENEMIIRDYSAALLVQFINHGRLYLSQNYICFYSNIFGRKIIEAIPLIDVVSIQKETKSSSLATPGITVKTKEKEYHFTSLSNREKIYDNIVQVWKCKGEQLVSSDKELDETTEEFGESEDDAAEETEDELTSILSNTETKSLLTVTNDDFIEILRHELNISLFKYFTLFISDNSEFEKKYHSIRGDKDLKIEKWKNNEEYGPIRQITYIAPVRVPMGPKQTRAEENQRYCLTKEKLIVETSSHYADIPFGSYFVVERKLEVQSIGEKKVDVRISIAFRFMKKTVLEGRIKANTISGMKEAGELWKRLSEEEVELYQSGKRKSVGDKTPPLQTNDKEVITKQLNPEKEPTTPPLIPLHSPSSLSPSVSLSSFLSNFSSSAFSKLTFLLLIFILYYLTTITAQLNEIIYLLKGNK